MDVLESQEWLVSEDGRGLGDAGLAVETASDDALMRDCFWDDACDVD